MLSRPTLTAMTFALLVAVVAAGQEFGHASAGQLVLVPKSSASRSGSIALRAGDARGLEATLGGTILKDRLWFFGSATLVDGISSRFSPVSPVSSQAIDAKLTAQLGTSQSVVATYDDRSSAFAPGSMNLPSSFLSLRWDGVVSPNAAFSATFSRRSSQSPLP